MWLYLPTFLSSPAQEDSTSPSDSQFQMLAACATSKGKLARPESWRRAWKTGQWNLLRSGVMCVPSQANSSVAEWMASLADFPAPISPSPESKPESSTASTVASGLNIYESFGRCNPDGSISKMSPQSSLFPQEELYLEGLLKSGSMRNGYLFERPTWVPRTGGSGSSSSRGSADLNWNTPSTEDMKSDGPKVMNRYGGGGR